MCLSDSIFTVKQPWLLRYEIQLHIKSLLKKANCTADQKFNFLLVIDKPRNPHVNTIHLKNTITFNFT